MEKRFGATFIAWSSPFDSSSLSSSYWVPKTKSDSGVRNSVLRVSALRGVCRCKAKAERAKASARSSPPSGGEATFKVGIETPPKKHFARRRTNRRSRAQDLLQKPPLHPIRLAAASAAVGSIVRVFLLRSNGHRRTAPVSRVVRRPGSGAGGVGPAEASLQGVEAPHDGLQLGPAEIDPVRPCQAGSARTMHGAGGWLGCALHPARSGISRTRQGR